MAELELLFKTRADLQGAKATLESIQKTVAASKELGLQQPIGELSKVIEDVTHGLDEIIPGFEKLGGIAVGEIAPVVAGFAAVAEAIHFGVEAVQEFARAELTIAQRDAALAQHGQLIEEVRTQYSELAEEIAKGTGTAKGEWDNVHTTLIKFGASSSTMRDATEGVKNLAGFLGGDLQGAAFAVGKALQGNYALLERYGIQVDHNARQSEQLDSIWEQLASRGGGQLEARLQTLNGRVTEAKNRWNDWVEAFGTYIGRLGIVQEGLKIASGAFERMARKQQESIDTSDALVNKLQGVATAGPEAAAGIAGVTDAAGRLDVAASKANAALQESIGSFQAFRRLGDSLQDSATSKKLAELDIAEAGGKMTPAEANAARAKIRTEAEQHRAETEHLEALRTEGAIKAKRDEQSRRMEAANKEAADVQGEFEGKAKEYGLSANIGDLSRHGATLQFAQKAAKTDGERARLQEELRRTQEVFDLGNLAAQREREAAQERQRGADLFSSTGPALRDAQVTRQGAEARLGTFALRRRADQAVGAQSIQREREQKAQEDFRTQEERHREDQRRIAEQISIHGTGMEGAGSKVAAAVAQHMSATTRALEAAVSSTLASKRDLERRIAILESQTANARVK
jgi:hypothetical protein